MSYTDYTQHRKKITDINGCIALLSWDKEVNLPPEAAQQRAQQVSTLSGISHNLSTSEDYGALLDKLARSKDLNSSQKVNIRRSREDYDKATKFTEEFVKEKSAKVSAAFHAWVKARAESDFSLFAPTLADLVDIARQEAEILGYDGHPYDALLDLYEPGLTVETMDAVFAPLKKDLLDLLEEIKNKPQVDRKILFGHFDKDKQWDFGEKVLKDIGYNFNAGRQDLSTHPFTINMGPADVRITTRIDESDFSYMLWSTIHEGGHALYEQGLPDAQYGLPAGTAASLGIHESQSRLWENNVGRSRDFWQHYFPQLQDVFPVFSGVTLDEFYKAINVVESNKIRTEADELHYHFHVLIRYEIEKALIQGELSVNDIPATWNKKYKKYLGVDIENDAEGALQDIHWSHGSFGYFPTYSLGSLYACQFFAQAGQDIDELSIKIQQGQFQELLSWLQDTIHVHGRRYTSEELCKKVTGSTLDSKVFLRYATEKYTDIYNL